jgi:hypothetical protein
MFAYGVPRYSVKAEALCLSDLPLKQSYNLYAHNIENLCNIWESQSSIQVVAPIMTMLTDDLWFPGRENLDCGPGYDAV